MAYRTLEITLISAKDLKDVNLISKMSVYAVVSLASDSRTRLRTPPDLEGGCNPTWNSTLRFTVAADNDLAHTNFFCITLRTKCALCDCDVGEVRVPLPKLLLGAGDGPLPVKFLRYQVQKTISGKPSGVLNFSYKLGKRVGALVGHAPPTRCPPQTTTYPLNRSKSNINSINSSNINIINGSNIEIINSSNIKIINSSNIKIINGSNININNRSNIKIINS